MTAPIVTGAAITGSAINESISQGITTLSNTSAMHFIADYGRQLPSLARHGDFFALLILFIAGYFLLLLINKFTGVIVHLIKNTFVFFITGFGVLYFYTEFRARAATGLTTETIIFGVLGIIIGILGLAFAIYAIFKKAKEGRTVAGVPTDAQYKKWRKDIGTTKAMPATTEEEIKEEIKEELEEEMHLKDMFSWDSVKADKSILSVLTFMVVAQFGVFSSKTIAAPNIQTGMILFVGFFLAAFFFIRQSYKKYATGLMHFLFALVIGFVLSIVLGAAWNEMAWTELISLTYFKTDSLIALISGMALSLFAGSKG